MNMIGKYDYNAEFAATNKPKEHLSIHNVKVTNEPADAIDQSIFIFTKCELPRHSRIGKIC